MIYKQAGPAGFWRGIKAALVLVTNPVLQYTAFEQLKKVLLAARRRRGGALTLSNVDIFLLGALAKLFATSLSYPLVLLKSRLVSFSTPFSSCRCQSLDTDTLVFSSCWWSQQSASHSYPSIPAALKDIVAKEGVAGLYSGIEAKLLQSVLSAALLFAGQQKVYEVCKRALVKV